MVSQVVEKYTSVATGLHIDIKLKCLTFKGDYFSSWWDFAACRQCKLGVINTVCITVIECDL